MSQIMICYYAIIYTNSFNIAILQNFFTKGSDSLKKIKILGIKTFNILKSNYQLCMILLLSSILNFLNLGIEGYANEYYAAGIKSMTMSLKNFFFVSFDPSGFVTIDKPPVGFWIQAISAKIFGFSGLSIIFPQALAGIISVGLLYYTVNRSFGKKAGLIAALCLSITPIFVAASRNNTIDNLLVLTSIISCLLLSLAAEKGSLKYLLISLAFVGIGFNIKMLEAYMILPALYITYLFASSISIKRKIQHLLLGTVILTVFSFSWAVIVDLVPAQNRPFIGSSTNNTVTELIAGHNGAERLNFSIKFPGINKSSPSNLSSSSKTTNVNNDPGQTTKNAINNESISTNGNPGVTRLFSENNLSDQISWFLPLALLGLIASIINQKYRKVVDKRKQLNTLLWGMCLIPECIYFSYIKSIGHAYYLTMMSPSIAALVGIGIVTMLELYKEGGVKAWILPISMLVNGAIESLILSYYELYYIAKELILVIGVFSFFSSLILIICIFIKNTEDQKIKRQYIFKKVLLAVAFTGLLIAPSFWSFTTVVYRMSGGSPAAGLRLVNTKNHELDAKDWFLPMKNSTNSTTEKLISFLNAHKTDGKYLLAVEKANDISDLIVKTGDPVIAIGGFSGKDKILTLDEFKSMVRSGEIKYALLRNGENENKEIDDWIRKNGERWDLSGSALPPSAKNSKSKNENEDNEDSIIIYELDKSL
ncbi:MAG: PMT family glycosyltransferase, 4-amino-4-deoxy-L-arabinose transferase [Clostridium sp. Maddingley MBC34-26]|nr:MAG: PMT family glycosyltransferase, 4-amino-4-deoxy-L-arabinose transferase [Clostridium sp. Maddingley MBC34-26]